MARRIFYRERGYSTPHTHTVGTQWYVDFYAVDPVDGKWKRKKYHASMKLGARERRKFLSEVLLEVNSKLASGWNPWAIEECSVCKTFDLAVEEYKKVVGKMKNQKSRASYLSKLKVLQQYNSTLPRPVVQGSQFTLTFCAGFLRWLDEEKGYAPCSRKNFQGWLGTLCKHLVASGFIKESPTNMLVRPRINPSESNVSDIPGNMLEFLSAYLGSEDRHFLLLCMMIYYGMFRPNELRGMKVGDIDLQSKVAYISYLNSKNKKNAYVQLNDNIISLMEELEISSYPGDFYLFGNDFTPSLIQSTDGKYAKKWKAVRDELGWSSAYKLYSLKHSGIRDLTAVEGIRSASMQARHCDEKMTNRYIRTLPPCQVAGAFEGNMKVTPRKKDSLAHVSKKLGTGLSWFKEAVLSLLRQ